MFRKSVGVNEIAMMAWETRVKERSAITQSFKKIEPKLDHIILKDDNDMKKLFDWKDRNRDLVRNFNPILKEGVIEFSEIYKQYFKQEGTIVDALVFFNGVLAMTYKIETRAHEITGDKDKNVIVLDQKTYSPLEEKQREELFIESITLHSTVMAYMENYKEYVTERRVQQNITKKGKKGDKNKNKTVKMGRKVYSVHVPEVIQDKPKREYSKHTEGFMVRGFWRTSKLGKRHFVPSYPKGDLRKIEPKKYEL